MWYRQVLFFRRKQQERKGKGMRQKSFLKKINLIGYFIIRGRHAEKA